MSRLHKNETRALKAQYFYSDDAQMDVNKDDSDFQDADCDAQDVYKSHIALLFLKMQEQCILPSSTVQFIFDSLKALIALTVEHIEENVEGVCKKNNVMRSPKSGFTGLQRFSGGLRPVTAFLVTTSADNI